MNSTEDTDEAFGNVMSTARPIAWAGTISLVTGEWVRLPSTDYEVRQDSPQVAWLAGWRVARLITCTGVSDVVRIDLGIAWAVAPVIADGKPQDVFNGPVDGTDIQLQIRYAPLATQPNDRPPAEMPSVASQLGEIMAAGT